MEDASQNKSGQRISLFSAIALSATSMVGSGWLFSAQLNAKIAGNYSLFAWIAAAALVMAVGLCLAQVASVFPVRGVTTRSSSLSHNGVFGMPFAFANWFGIMVVIATEAQATTQYLAAVLKNTVLMDADGLTFTGKTLALAILFAYLVINFYGIQFLAKVNNLVTVLKVFSPLFAIVLFFIAKFDTSNFTLASNSQYSYSSITTAIVSAGLIYSYNGFQIAVAYASEIKNPKRNIPLSIILSILIVMGVYMLLQVSFMGAVPHDQLTTGGWASLNFHSPLVDLAMLLGLNFLVIVLLADSTISPSGTGFAYLGASARMFHAMALAGQMPKFAIGNLHPKYFLDRRSLLINWVLSAIFLWNAKSWASLMVIVTGYHIIGYMAAPISMGAIKPRTRIFGVIVFVLLGLITATLPANDFFMMNMSLVVLMAIFGCIQLSRGTKISVLLKLILPFLAYLWMIYLYQDKIFIVVVSAVFYIVITSKSYVDFCRSNNITSVEVDEETGIALNGKIEDGH